MVYLRVKFHVPNCNSSSVTAIKPNVKENLFYTLQKQYLKKSCLFFTVYYNTKFQGIMSIRNSQIIS
jgi:hypothetical protein